MGYGIEPAHDLAASRSVFYDYAFGPESIEQDRLACEKRTHPISQLHSCIVVRWVADGLR